MRWSKTRREEPDAQEELRSMELRWALSALLTVEEGQALAENFRTYRWSFKFIHGVRLVFLPSLGLLALSFSPWFPWLVGQRWLLGLLTLVSFLGVCLMRPVLEGAIDSLQALADQALARAGLPPYALRK